jgi:hypothetical protein
MNTIFSFVTGLLIAESSLLCFVQNHPELPQASRDQAQQIAQQAITQATQAINTASTQTQPPVSNNKSGSATISKSSLTSNSSTLTITGTCKNISGALAISIVTSSTTLSSNKLPDSPVYSEHSDHGGQLDSSCNLNSGTFSTHYDNPKLQQGTYTVGMYTYTNTYTDAGYQGPADIQLLTTETLTIGTQSTGSNGLIITYPATGTALMSGQKITIRWNIPASVTSSFPSDFRLGLNLNVVRTDAPAINVIGINDGTNDPRTGSVVWEVPTDTAPGTYIIDAYLSAEPKDFSRLCAVAIDKDCSPSEADNLVMARASQYKTESGSFVIKSSKSDAVSVPGMSKYTDSDFSFSFWYPSGWKVSDVSVPVALTYGGTVVKRIEVASKTTNFVIEKLHSPSRKVDIGGGTCGYCGPVTYYFDLDLHTWMKQYPMGMNGAPDATQEQMNASKIPKSANVSNNTMGGLHIFSTEQKENASIIPLSAQNFLIIGEYSGKNPTSRIEQPLVKTIIATDPAVATPVSVAEQIKTIQAEKDEYTGQ